MNPFELLMHRRQIAASIRANPLPLTLERRTRVATPGGGVTTSAMPTEVAEQQFLLVETAGRGSLEGTISRAEGELMKADFILIGRHDADIAAGDGLWHEGRHFECYYVSPYKQIRTAAGITVWGGTDTRDFSG